MYSKYRFTRLQIFFLRNFDVIVFFLLSKIRFLLIHTKTSNFLYFPFFKESYFPERETAFYGGYITLTCGLVFAPTLTTCLLSVRFCPVGLLCARLCVFRICAFSIKFSMDINWVFGVC